jgi:hypothetical protein
MSSNKEDRLLCILVFSVVLPEPNNRLPDSPLNMRTLISAHGVLPHSPAT